MSDYKKLQDDLVYLQSFLTGFSDESIDDSLIEDIEKISEEMNSFTHKTVLEYETSDGRMLNYNYESDSGFDLYSIEDVEIPSFGRALVNTGVKFNIPLGYEIQIRSKSGLALNQGLMVLNSPGTVDQGYTGEIKVIIFNTTNKKFDIPKGMKIAQAVLQSVMAGKFVDLKKIDSVEKKDRGSNGFGSTGI